MSYQILCTGVGLVITSCNTEEKITMYVDIHENHRNDASIPLFVFSLNGDNIDNIFYLNPEKTSSLNIRFGTIILEIRPNDKQYGIRIEFPINKYRDVFIQELKKINNNPLHIYR